MKKFRVVPGLMLPLCWGDEPTRKAGLRASRGTEFAASAPGEGPKPLARLKTPVAGSSSPFQPATGAGLSGITPRAGHTISKCVASRSVSTSLLNLPGASLLPASSLAPFIASEGSGKLFACAQK